MPTFLAAFGHLVLGVLHGFDRLVFRGHLRQLAYAHGMDCYLAANRVLLKDFQAHVRERTALLIDASLAEARRLQRPTPYLNDSHLSKETEARRIAQHDQLREGLICVFKSVEPCWTFEVHRNRQRRRLELRGKHGKCSFLYHYYLHPVFGLMHVRLQTWFPFTMQVCLNGREWLARQLVQAGLAYTRRDNKFTAVADFAAAQACLNHQRRTAWPKRLDELVRQVHPAHPQLLGRMPVPYYWSVYQSEWATDIVFRTPADLAALYAPWLRHAVTSYRSTDVLRFLGRAVPAHGQVRQGFAGEVQTDLGHRVDGVRIKHWLNGNSLKMYDCANVLRIETTINQVKDFKVYRTSETDPDGAKQWRVLRRGVADLQRRAKISQDANERYAGALAAVQQARPLKEVAEPMCRPAAAPGGGRGRRARALNPLAAADAALLEAVSDPQYALHGLRNRDVVARLYDEPAPSAAERRRRSARVTRLLRLLRAHGILQKVPKTHRYQISTTARNTLTALLAARNASADFLASNAA
jgi:hypothetical protein